MKTDLSSVNWFKSSHSSGQTECVEVAWLEGSVGIRDSKNPTGPALAFTPGEWDAFAAGVRDRNFSSQMRPVGVLCRLRIGLLGGGSVDPDAVG